MEAGISSKIDNTTPEVKGLAAGGGKLGGEKIILGMLNAVPVYAKGYSNIIFLKS
jgi:hypothetical protein